MIYFLYYLFYRFEPGDIKTVCLVNIGGKRVIKGGNNICNGPVSDNPEILNKIMENLQSENFLNLVQVSTNTVSTSEKKKRKSDGEMVSQNSNYKGLEIERKLYARMYGPTTGDIVRLGDTELFVEVEYDMTVYGDECKFGGGKVLREGQGQTTGIPASAQLDTVITNALIIDYTGIYKADIGIKNGIIIGIGKAGNGDMMEEVSEVMAVGVNTEVIAGEGKRIEDHSIITNLFYFLHQFIII